MVLGTAQHLADPGQKREAIKAAGEWLDANVPEEVEILVTSDEMASLVYYHWPERMFRLYPDRKTAVTEENVESIAEQLPFTGSDKVIYIFGRSWLSDPKGKLREELKSRYSLCQSTEVRGISIYCFLKKTD